MEALHLADSWNRLQSRIFADPIRLVLCLSFTVMTAISWPLWVETDRFPRLPFIPGLPNLGPIGSRFLFASLLATSLLGIVNRLGLATSAAILAWLIAGDQNRFQPWAYQYALIAFALVLLPKGRARSLARLFIIALYFHSGVSKLDVSFCRETGPWMVGPIWERLGSGVDHAIAPGYYLVFPFAEIAIAIGLGFRRTRGVALVSALAMHAALLVFLGPLGRRQSGDLLIWNVAIMLEDCILFRSNAFEVGPMEGGERLWEPWVRVLFVFAAVLPFGERFGVWDAWPSFALYAGHVERTEIAIAPEAAGDLPIEARNALRRVGDDPWLRLDPTSWSRAVRGTPVYPSNRTSIGLAEAIASRIEHDSLVRAIAWGRADPFTGKRERREAIGLEQIRRLGNRFRWNARPEGAFVSKGRNHSA